MSSVWAFLCVAMVVIRPHLAALPDAVSVYIFDVAIIFIFPLVFILETPSAKLSPRLVRVSLLWVACLLSLSAVHLVHLMRGEGGGTAPLFMKWVLYGIFSLSILRLDDVCKEFRPMLRRQFLVSIWLVLAVAVVQAAAIPVVYEAAIALYGEAKLKPFTQGQGRVYGTFYNANWFGVFSAATLLLAIRHRCAWRPLHVLALVSCLALSGSRSSIGMAVIGMLITSVKTMLFVGMALAAFTFGNIEPDDVPKRLLEVRALLDTGSVEQIPSLVGRVETWGDASEAIAENPLTGSGNLDLVSHNAYMSLAGKVGLPVAALCIGFVFSALFAVGGGAVIGPSLAFAAILFTGDYLEATQVVLALMVLFAALGGSGDMSDVRPWRIRQRAPE